MTIINYLFLILNPYKIYGVKYFSYSIGKWFYVLIISFFLFKIYVSCSCLYLLTFPLLWMLSPKDAKLVSWNISAMLFLFFIYVMVSAIQCILNLFFACGVVVWPAFFFCMWSFNFPNIFFVIVLNYTWLCSVFTFDTVIRFSLGGTQINHMQSEHLPAITLQHMQSELYYLYSTSSTNLRDIVFSSFSWSWFFCYTLYRCVCVLFLNFSFAIIDLWPVFIPILHSLLFSPCNRIWNWLT